MADEIINDYVQGDTIPTLVRTAPLAQVPGGTLVGHTVRMKFRRPDGVTIVKAITEVDDPLNGHIDDAANRGFFIRFVATDLLEGNMQRAEFEYDDGSGGVSTERDIFVDVGPALGT